MVSHSAARHKVASLGKVQSSLQGSETVQSKRDPETSARAASEPWETPESGATPGVVIDYDYQKVLTHTHTYMHICIHMYTCLYVCVYIYTHIYVIYIYIYMCICMYVYIYIYVCIRETERDRSIENMFH